MRYLNNAGTSWPKPPAVHAAVLEALAAAPAERGALFERAHGRVAAFLGLPTPERLLLTGGCTAALALALGDLPWTESDVLLTSSLEHHALARPAEKLQRERGVTWEVAPYAPGEPVDLDFVEATLGRGRVRLVAVTAASNVTGELLPTAELCRLAHAHGAIVLLDAAQTLGVVPTTVDAVGADIVVFAGHKGGLAPGGIGGFWAREGVAFETPWAACEVTPGAGERPECSPFPGYCDVGSVNLPGAAGLAAGLEWHAAQAGEVGDHARGLAADCRRRVAELPGCRVLGAGDVHTATLSIEVDALPLEAAEAYFLERGLVVRAGQHCAPLALAALGASQGTLRVSFGPLNVPDDVDRLLGAIAEAAAPSR